MQAEASPPSPDETCSETDAAATPPPAKSTVVVAPNNNSNSSSGSPENNNNTSTTTSNGSSSKKEKQSKSNLTVYHTPGSNMKLIKLVRKEPCLWDPRHLQYRDSAKKDKCWEEIARQVSMEIGHARQRWKSLRDTFTKKVRKIAIIEAAGGYTGSGEDPCQWKYFQQLKFLENVIHTQRPRLQPASGQSQPVKNTLALSNITVSINPLDCDDEDESPGPQRAWPLSDERELIHYMRDYPLLWNRKDPGYKNDASRDMAIIQIHTNFQERYTWSEIQSKINFLVRKFHENDSSWMHQDALAYLTNGTSNGLKSEPIDSDEGSEECNTLMPQIEIEEVEEVKSVTVSTTSNPDGAPTVKVLSTSSQSPVHTPKPAAYTSNAPFSIQTIQNSTLNGQPDPASGQGAPIKIITVAPNSGQNFSLGGTASNGGTILIPSNGQGILQMLQTSKSPAQMIQENLASTTEKRIESFTTWIKAYLAMVEPEDLDKIELEIHELMVKHTKKSKDRKTKSRTPRQPAKKPHLDNGVSQEPPGVPKKEDKDNALSKLEQNPPEVEPIES